MIHNTLANYYKTMFALKIHHSFDIAYVENLMPFELEVYTTLLMQYIEEENDRIKRQQQQMNH